MKIAYQIESVIDNTIVTQFTTQKKADQFIVKYIGLPLRSIQIVIPFKKWLFLKVMAR